jgi:hypothetical protein
MTCYFGVYTRISRATQNGLMVRRAEPFDLAGIADPFVGQRKN